MPTSATSTAARTSSSAGAISIGPLSVRPNSMSCRTSRPSSLAFDDARVRRSRRRSSGSRSQCSNTVSTKPLTAVSGVRSSWETRARNSLFCWSAWVNLAATACSRSDARAHCSRSSRWRRRYRGRYGAAPTTTPNPSASVNAPTSVLGWVTAPAMAEPRLGSPARWGLLVSSARPATSDEPGSGGVPDGGGFVGSAGPAGSPDPPDGSGVAPGAVDPACGPDDPSEPPLEPLGADEPGTGGTPGAGGKDTSGRPGPLDPPSSWPGMCTSMPRPGSPMSIGGGGDGRQYLRVRRRRHSNRDAERGGRDGEHANERAARHVGTPSRSARTELDVAAGIDTKNVEPNPGSLSTLIRPP